MNAQEAQTYLKFYTQYYTSVDSSDGAVISFSEPVELVCIETSANYTITGNGVEDSTAASYHSYLADPRWIPIAGPADKPLFTIKAQSGTINVSVWGFSNR
jgi:hypothetical protein